MRAAGRGAGAAGKEKTIYGFVFRHSLVRHSQAQQLFLPALTVASFPALYVSLELPKQIVNDPIGGCATPSIRACCASRRRSSSAPAGARASRW